MEIIVTFLIILELMKTGRISICQENLFDDIIGSRCSRYRFLAASTWRSLSSKDINLYILYSSSFCTSSALGSVGGV